MRADKDGASLQVELSTYLRPPAAADKEARRER
jgi:hypothetical protein